MEKQNFSNALSRILSSAIDGIFCGIPYAISAYSSNKIISIVFLIVTFLFAVFNLYLLVKQRSTIGMKFLEIKMYKITGENITESPLTYGYIILRNIISGIISSITYGVEYIFIFFTKKKQTFHDILFKSVFLNNPPQKKYIEAIGVVILVIIIGIATKNFFLENRMVLTYKINNIDKLEAYGVLRNDLKGVIPENKILFNEKNNEFSIILPIGLDRKIVEEKVSQRVDSLIFKEQINGIWINSDLGNSYIKNAELFFSDENETKVLTNVLIKFKPEKNKILQSFSERNLNKEVKINIGNEEIFSGTVSEVITTGEIIFPKDSISAVKDIVAKINMGNSEALTFINESNKKLIKDTFTWMKE